MTVDKPSPDCRADVDADARASLAGLLMDRAITDRLQAQAVVDKNRPISPFSQDDTAR